MPRRVFILGGTGQIGQAVAHAFLVAGWNVTMSHRGKHPPPQDLIARGATLVTLDRDAPGALSGALGAGADALVDTTAYERNHASQLLALQADVGGFVVISSASVYRDELGRTLDEAPQNGFPSLPDPIPETQATVDPGPGTYSTRKVALERHMLDDAAVPVTILRPCAIHGRHSRHPREWWLVKRMLDHRPAIPLAYRGTSRFHTTAVANIAALTKIAAETPATRVLNIADPRRPASPQSRRSSRSISVTRAASSKWTSGAIRRRSAGRHGRYRGRSCWIVARRAIWDTRRQQPTRMPSGQSATGW